MTSVGDRTVRFSVAGGFHPDLAQLLYAMGRQLQLRATGVGLAHEADRCGVDGAAPHVREVLDHWGSPGLHERAGEARMAPEPARIVYMVSTDRISAFVDGTSRRLEQRVRWMTWHCGWRVPRRISTEEKEEADGVV